MLEIRNYEAGFVYLHAYIKKRLSYLLCICRLELYPKLIGKIQNFTVFCLYHFYAPLCEMKKEEHVSHCTSLDITEIYNGRKCVGGSVMT